MALPLSFTGRIGPLAYGVWSLGAFLSQHAMALLLLTLQGRSPVAIAWDGWFLLLPFRVLVGRNPPSDAALIFAFGYWLIVAWALAALASRRAADAGVSAWVAALAMAPVVQIAVMLVLSVLPSKAADGSPRPNTDANADWAATVQGVLAGTGLTLFAVAVGALIFRTYGYGMFVVSPFVIGATTAYLVNRKGDRGLGRTSSLVASSTLLGGAALVFAALEGVICIIMAAPLGIGLAIVGGLLGRAIALYSQRPRREALSGLAVLPLVFAAESALPPATHFETHATIEVRAPPAVVWQHLVRMDLSDQPVGLPFRLGLAYPLRGEVVGEGTGGTRLGHFSTGTALERLIEWLPDRKLAFTPLNDVPAMRELSPYTHVHAPHVVGYFRTLATSFELVPNASGDTEVHERTSHELRLEPVLYWLPFARWAVQQNNARVLVHIKREAERAAGAR